MIKYGVKLNMDIHILFINIYSILNFIKFLVYPINKLLI